MMKTFNHLILRDLRQQRLRTVLSAMAVALGVAMIIAAGMISQAVQSAISGSGASEVQVIATWMVDAMGSMLGAVGVVVVLVAGFLIFNAFAMSIAQRRQQIGLLRSLGMSRPQVMRFVLTQALVTGLLGTAVGLVIGPLLGRGVVALIKLLTAEFFAFGESAASLESLALAAALGIGTTLCSVFFPARSATIIPPLAALREEAAADIQRLSPWWLRAALVGTGVLILYLVLDTPGRWIQPPMDWTLAVLLVVAWLVLWGVMLPGVIGNVAGWSQGFLSRRWGAAGRLISDNLQRGRRRITLTIMTMAVGLMMILAMTGFITFVFQELFMNTAPDSPRRIRTVMPFDMTKGMSAYMNMDLTTLQLPTALLDDVKAAVAGNGVVTEFYFVLVPELSFLIPNYFSFVVDPHALSSVGPTFFRFSEGDWETALPIMDAGCGVLVPPMVATQNDTGLGGVIRVQGVDGPVECTIAGIGSGFVNASIIGLGAGDAFGIENPLSLSVVPLVGADEEALDAALMEVMGRYPGNFLTTLDILIDAQGDASAMIVPMFNGMLLLTIVTAALGVVNTTVISVTERRQELGLLRAVGATQRQVRGVVMGEAALMGIVGGAAGFVAGVGIIFVFVLTYGGNAWAVEIDLWPALWRSLQPVLLTGVIGMVLAPIISAGAAWLPTRSTLRASPVEMLAQLH